MDGDGSSPMVNRRRSKAKGAMAMGDERSGGDGGGGRRRSTMPATVDDGVPVFLDAHDVVVCLEWISNGVGDNFEIRVLEFGFLKLGIWN